MKTSKLDKDNFIQILTPINPIKIPNYISDKRQAITPVPLFTVFL